MAAVEDFYGHVLERYRDRIVDVVEVGPEPFDLLPYEFPEEIKKRLLKAGIEKLYEHQVRSLELLSKNRDVCLVSPTASGKSLIYLIPVLENYLKDPSSTFLFVFPTKSLSQDQIKNASSLLPEALPAVYDGDTPKSLRRFIRENSKIVATNPDMLHFGMIPNHALWGSFFRNLKLIAVDEIHVYRGAFGSNVAYVLRRLLRIASIYGSKPQVVMASATIGNPEELAEKLTGRKVEVVKVKKISPLKKTFVFWNPPYDAARNRRMSPNRDAIALFSESVAFGLRTIVFSRSKQTAEIVAKHARERVPDELKNKITVYRAGLTAERRRDIEQKLFSGEIAGVSTTPALELGIDIGDLNVAIINRFPGTVSSFFQQAGRAGRRQKSLVFYIAGEDPLDQYYVTHAAELMTKPKEQAIVDLTNEYIARRHVLSAAFELPVRAQDFESYLPAETLSIVEDLLEKGFLRRKGSTIFLSPGERRPHDFVAIRTASPENYCIVDASSGEMIGTLEGSLAFFYLHPGAVYLHETETYLVKDLDIVKKLAFVETAGTVPYYTITLEDVRVEVVEKFKTKRVGLFSVSFGKLRVSNQVIGYNKKHVLTDEMLGFEPLDLPPVEITTHGMWFELAPETAYKLAIDESMLAGGIHGIEHAQIALLPFFAGCDRWDIGGMSATFHPDTNSTTIFIYDGYEGGIGLTERGYEVFEEHIFKTLETIEKCQCMNGCPGCIVSPKCGNNNEPLDKQSAIRILRYNLTGEVK